MDWAYCVTPARTLGATMVGTDGAGVEVPFSVGDYRGALHRHVGAWDGFAEAPFFIGRRVALVFDGMTAGGPNGPRGPLYVLP